MPRGEVLCSEMGRPAAIWQGIPGEKAEVHVYHKGQNRWLGRWKRAIGGEHPARVVPPCSRYSACGGCPLMHLNAAGQDEARRFLVKDAFKAAELEMPSLEETVRGDDGEFGFRHVVKLAVGRSERGHVRIGAFGRNSRDIIPIPECLVAAPPIREVMKSLAFHVLRAHIDPYDPVTGRGLLRYAVIRLSRAHGELMVTLVASRQAGILRQLAQDLMTSLPELVGVHLHINDGPGNAIFDFDGGFKDEAAQGVPFLRLDGRKMMEERVGGMRIWLGPGAFFQTNPAVADRLYRLVASHVHPKRPLLDLYCGVGAMTLAGATRTELAIGVDAVEPAVMLAREAANRNSLPAEFILAQVDENIEEASVNLGVPPVKTFLKVTTRMIFPGIATGGLLAWTTSVSDLTCTILIYPARWKTLTVETYAQIRSDLYGPASVVGIFLLLSVMVPIFIVNLISQRRDRKKSMVKNER